VETEYLLRKAILPLDDPVASRNGVPGAFPTVANAGGGLSEALEKGFGQAKLFFNTGVGPGRASSLASNSTELLDGAEDYPASSSLDRKAKLSNTATTPAIITKPKKVSKAFHQFLDATYQILHQNPTHFEYNERFLRRLLYHLYSCQYGTFFHNNDKERHCARILEHSRSVWDYFIAWRERWIKEKYDPAANGTNKEREIGGGRVFFPKTGAAIRWWECWVREVGEMNGSAISLPVQVFQRKGAGVELEVEEEEEPVRCPGGRVGLQRGAIRG